MQVEASSESPSYDLAGAFARAMAEMSVRPAASAPPRIAIAVSGGADSMALAVLVSAWSRSHGAVLHALTVDHGLRDAAADEAQQVARWMSALGVRHTTLLWEEGGRYRDRPSSAQAAAREARYELLLGHCKENAVSHLLLGHHAEDQAETVLLRLARGSGVDGLGAMAPLSHRAGIRIARPLLTIPKQRLIAYLNEIGQPWIEDPSNDDPGYARVRLRAAESVLKGAGLSADRLQATAVHMRRARAALDHYAQKLIDDACTWDRFGVARINLEPFLKTPEEIGLRVLARLLMSGSGQTYRPRFERLERLYRTICAGPWRDATLHGCLLIREGSVLTIMRESAHITDEVVLAAGVKTVWDGRFEVEAKGLGTPLRVRRLRSGDADPELRRASGWRSLPALARDTLPALFDSQGLAAVPPLNYVRADLTTLPGVTLSAGFICPRIDQFLEDDAEL